MQGIISSQFTTGVILWRSVLLVKETRVLGENHRTTTSRGQIYHKTLNRAHLAISRARTHNISGDKALIA